MKKTKENKVKQDDVIKEEEKKWRLKSIKSFQLAKNFGLISNESFVNNKLLKKALISFKEYYNKRMEINQSYIKIDKQIEQTKIKILMDTLLKKKDYNLDEINNALEYFNALKTRRINIENKNMRNYVNHVVYSNVYEDESHQESNAGNDSFRYKDITKIHSVLFGTHFPWMITFVLKRKFTRKGIYMSIKLNGEDLLNHDGETCDYGNNKETFNILKNYLFPNKISINEMDILLGIAPNPNKYDNDSYLSFFGDYDEDEDDDNNNFFQKKIKN